MIEVVGKHPPINVLKPPSEMSSLEISLDGDLDDAESAAFHGDIDEKEAGPHENYHPIRPRGTFVARQEGC